MTAQDEVSALQRRYLWLGIRRLPWLAICLPLLWLHTFFGWLYDIAFGPLYQLNNQQGEIKRAYRELKESTRV